MSTEYECLREEITAWQERRFVILAGSIALVTGILGLKVVGESNPSENWPWATALLLAMLSTAGLLTWYAALANAKIAAYLIVYHESDLGPFEGWERRLQRLKDAKHDLWSLNRLMIPIYFILGLLSVIIPMQAHKAYHLTDVDYVALTITGVAFVCALVLLGVKPPKKLYEDRWKALKAEEAKGNPAPHAH